MNKPLIQSAITIAIFFLFSIASFPAHSDSDITSSNSSAVENTTRIGCETDSLDKARSKIGDAFDSYKNKNIAASKKSLRDASDWLNKAAQDCKTDKAREESRKLAIAIDEYNKHLNQSTEKQQNSLARFWHQTTSIIKRETDQLLHSYVNLSIEEKTLKHLLDAKMHLFTAEHDLFVSHDPKDAEEQLSSVVEYLNKAGQVAKPATSARVIELRKNIENLKDSINTKQEIWKKDSVVLALNKATKDLNEAKNNASPTTKLRIDLLTSDIQDLRTYVEKDNIKNNYEMAMVTLQNIINEL